MGPTLKQSEETLRESRAETQRQQEDETRKKLDASCKGSCGDSGGPVDDTEREEVDIVKVEQIHDEIYEFSAI